MIEDLVDVDQAVAVANEVKDEVARAIQTQIAPMMKERAEHASTVAASAAQDVQTWLQETAPARQQALETAHSHFSSFWERLTSTGADAVSKAEKLAVEYGQPSAAGAEDGSARLSTMAAEHSANAAAATAAAASRASQHAASLWNVANAAVESATNVNGATGYANASGYTTTTHEAIDPSSALKTPSVVVDPSAS